jgi:hypothetical protein
MLLNKIIVITFQIYKRRKHKYAGNMTFYLINQVEFNKFNIKQYLINQKKKKTQHSVYTALREKKERKG